MKKYYYFNGIEFKFSTSSVAYAPAFPQVNFSVNPSFAATLGEVASAVCAEVGGVILQFYLYPHHCPRDISP